MAENYKHSGFRVPVVSASADILSGALVSQEKFIGVAMGNMATGASGWLGRTGVWRLPVEAAVERGFLLYADTGGAELATIELTATATTNTFVGVALTDRDAAGFADVLLNGRGIVDVADV